MVLGGFESQRAVMDEQTVDKSGLGSLIPSL